MSVKKVFITKNIEDISEFSDYCLKNKIHLEASSFITFSVLANRLRKASDVYFFSSKKSFDFFRETHNIEINKKISCIGKETKNHIENFGYIVDFYSENAGSPDIAAEEFKLWLGNKKVAFVLSQISYRSISSKIPENQKEDLVLYNTEILSSKLKKNYDIYVFTSPSNVTGFFKENVCKEGSLIISWGKSTEKELKNYVNKIDYTLKESSYNELMKYISENII